MLFLRNRSIDFYQKILYNNTMKRDYATGEAETVTYFVGDEVEVTPAHGKKTLFVVGVRPLEEITDIATTHDCDHVYLGANQSFNGKDINDWDKMIRGLLGLGFMVTLDFDSWYCYTLRNWLAPLNEFDNFIAQISVKIPHITKYNDNATVKIDDIDFNATNRGVWCHSLNELQEDSLMTNWSEYGNDKIINKEDV